VLWKCNRLVRVSGKEEKFFFPIGKKTKLVYNLSNRKLKMEIAMEVPYGEDEGKKEGVSDIQHKKQNHPVFFCTDYIYGGDWCFRISEIGGGAE